MYVYVYVCKNIYASKHVCWLFGFYGISTFIGYLMPNSIL